MNKTITLSLAALGVAGMIGGGTFAAWSDFDDSFTDNGVGAGHLILNVDSAGALANGNPDNLAPGINYERIFYVASNDGDSVPNGDLSMTMTSWDDLVDTCTSNSESLIDGDCAGGAGDLAKEARLTVYKWGPTDPAAVSTTSCNPVPGAASLVYDGYAADAVTEGALTIQDDLAPGDGMCVRTVISLNKIQSNGVPGMPGGPVAPATNLTQGDAAEYDVRFDLAQS